MTLHDCATGPPDVILACAGDVPTLETLAAADWLRQNVPSMRFRVVNVVDLMSLFSPREHPHGMTDDRFAELFTRDTHVVFSFHGYAGAIHQLLHGRPEASRFHVRGYKEEGTTTTTPFDMVVLDDDQRLRHLHRCHPPQPATSSRCPGARPGLSAHAREASRPRRRAPRRPARGIREWTWTAR